MEHIIDKKYGKKYAVAEYRRLQASNARLDTWNSALKIAIVFLIIATPFIQFNSIISKWISNLI